MPKPAPDLTGRQWSYLTALRRFGRTPRGDMQWVVGCVCGAEKVMLAKELQKGREKSCGCMRGTLVRKANSTHSMSQHPTYWVWRSMQDRCRLPTHQAWHNYGARGIRVCPQWDTFENFWTDMGPTYQPGLTIERVNNMGDYTPTNCTWATPMAQGNNKRNNVLLDTPWGRVTMAEASRLSGIGKTTLHYRLKAGASASTIFSTPDVSTALSSRGRPGR